MAWHWLLSSAGCAASFTSPFTSPTWTPPAAFTAACWAARKAEAPTPGWTSIFFGHQISLHLGTPFASARTGHVGDHLVPMPHFGAILELPDWHALAARLKAAGTAFVLEPQVRFEGQPGEQWTMFFHDPSGNPIEIKGFRSLDAVYAT